MRIAKRKHYLFFFHNAKNDPKRMWKHIKDIIHKGKKDSSYPDHFIENDRVVSDRKSIANSFNSFFVNLGPPLAENIPNCATKSSHDHLNQQNVESSYLSLVNVNGFLKVAHGCLNPRKAADYNGLRPDIVRRVLHYIVEPLTYIFYISLSRGAFPDRLKVATVIPVFKKVTNISL